MKARVEVASESGIVVVADPAANLPSGLDQEKLLRQLEPRARSGELFFLAADDPIAFRIDVYVGESPPADFDRQFEPVGGGFRLDAPRGRVTLAVWNRQGDVAEAGAIAVGPGRHLLTVQNRRPFDGARHSEHMLRLVGEDWWFVETVDRLGLLGCLPLLLAALSLITARWRWLAFLAPVVVLSWLPYVVLRRTRRYRAAERLSAQHEKELPHYVLRLEPTLQDGLPGGFVRV